MEAPTVAFAAEGAPSSALAGCEARLAHPTLVEGLLLRSLLGLQRVLIDALLSLGWDTVSVQHKVTGKYLKQKCLWELVCTKSAG